MQAAAVDGTIRALAWQTLDAAGRATAGDAAWAAARDEAGAPPLDALDPFDRLPREPFGRALEVLAKASPDPDAALRALGRAWARAWARTYRSLARQVRGQPGRMLEVFCGEAYPWLLDAPGASRVVDAGPEGCLVSLPGALPEPFEQGLLVGLVEASGRGGARVARRGEHVAVAWEGAQAARAPWSALAGMLRAVRAPALPATLVPVLVGAALAWKDGFLDPAYLGLTALGAALFHLAANLTNDYFDHRSAADDANLTPTPFSGGSRAIQRGLLTPRQVLGLAAALYALGVAAGLHIAFHLQAERGAGLLPVLGLGLAGFLVGVLYSAPPVRLAHRGLGELAVGMGFGPLLTAGTYLVQRTAALGEPRVTPEVMLLSVALGALVAAMLTINEIPDRPWDAQAGKRTLAVRLAPRRAVHLYAGLLVLAYAAIALAALLFRAWPVLLALAPAPLAGRALLALQRHQGEPYRLLPANAATAFAHLATGLLLSGGILLSRLAPGGP
jgi:1,4-dihydroxy-2-naphthoate octaprenyltransferase